VTSPNNLPAELSSFVGRERQLAELRRLLRKSRLITLTGPGGAGKTRLAIRLASDMLDRHPDGAWLVELPTIGDAGLLEQTVATACGVREERKRPILEALVNTLDRRHVLLILDGCEHLVDACAALASRLLRSCPALTILVTSREPLGVPGELTWRTPSLSLPRIEDAGHPEVLLQSEAVRLFAERARLNRPEFELDQSVSAAVAQICARLEGMPLAIELAASLERVMTPDEILERLRDRFRLLTGGSRTLLPRQQTLRQAVDWSYDLLSPAEKALLARLAVFAGGFDLAAAEAVGQSSASDPSGVLQHLPRLVDKSLVTAEHLGPQTTRYRIPDTIHEYALEKLQQSEKTDTRRRHARHFVAWCSRAAVGLLGREQEAWLRKLDQEQSNLRLALEWSLTEQPDDALRLASAMFGYWDMRHRFAEGLGWLDQALDLEASSTAAKASALLARSRLHWRRGEYAQVRDDAEECIALCRELRLDLELSGALTLLGLLSSGGGDWSAAKRFHQEALDVGRKLGDHLRIAFSLNNLALVESALGDHQGARTRLLQALAEIQSTGNTFNIGVTLDSLGRVSLKLEANAESRVYYLEALAIAAHFENPPSVANCLEGLGLLAIAEGDAGRTLRFVSAAKGLRQEAGDKSAPDWVDAVEEGVMAARARLSQQAADTAWREGAAWSLEEAVRQATGAAARPAGDGKSPLTARERQVAGLVAEGLTNGEIAVRLKMAGRTADAHVEHIRNKLGLRSRAQIAIWAHDQLGTA
jgi:predicted ATPase/DNA-binding CsgD family transcriptional regulator